VGNWGDYPNIDGKFILSNGNAVSYTAATGTAIIEDPLDLGDGSGGSGSGGSGGGSGGNAAVTAPVTRYAPSPNVTGEVLGWYSHNINTPRGYWSYPGALTPPEGADETMDEIICRTVTDTTISSKYDIQVVWSRPAAYNTWALPSQFTFNWNQGNVVFDGGVRYLAVITLTAREGYTFPALTANSIAYGSYTRGVLPAASTIDGAANDATGYIQTTAGSAEAATATVTIVFPRTVE
jgi:hypothetical protein